MCRHCHEGDEYVPHYSHTKYIIYIFCIADVSYKIWQLILKFITLPTWMWRTVRERKRVFMSTNNTTFPLSVQNAHIFLKMFNISLYWQRQAPLPCRTDLAGESVCLGGRKHGQRWGRCACEGSALLISFSSLLSVCKVINALFLHTHTHTDVGVHFKPSGFGLLWAALLVKDRTAVLNTIQPSQEHC